MKIYPILKKTIAPIYNRSPKLKDALLLADTYVDCLRHTVAEKMPRIIRPDPRWISICITADCNSRCLGCRYGRDFMKGQQLSLKMIKDLLDDAKKHGIQLIRFYGGEPLLHKDITKIVEYSVKLGLTTSIATNGVLLKEKIDKLYEVGLRKVNIGFYGIGNDYNNYVQRKNQFSKVEESVAYARERYGNNLKMNLGWVLMRPTGNIKSLNALWHFAKRYKTPIAVNLIHYSLPYFRKGKEGELQFLPEDRPVIEDVVKELLLMKKARPDLIPQSSITLRSIPEWLMKGSEMLVPCDRYRTIWIGADGSVLMCHVKFKLGNLHESRLTDLLFTPEHKKAAIDAFLLKCPNCYCAFETRTLSFRPTRRLYAH